MNWTLENMTFVVIMVCAACGALMALVNVVCEIVRMTPWGRKRFGEVTLSMAEKIINENYILYTCPECGETMRFSNYLENYCAKCGHKITDEEKKKYEKV